MEESQMMVDEWESIVRGRDGRDRRVGRMGDENTNTFGSQSSESDLNNCSCVST